jgi:putative tricarboxylic transport membrane protein
MKLFASSLLILARWDVVAALLAGSVSGVIIGLEPIQYSQRYTIGKSWLSGGVDLIVVVLWLFTLTQASETAAGYA